MLIKAIRRLGKPKALYLDNGASYRGDILHLVCARLQISIIHSKPYRPQGKGKIERFFRTLREQCLAFLTTLPSIEALSARLWAFVDESYHRNPHAGLMGKTPADVMGDCKGPPVDEDSLRKSFIIKERRRVRKDSTLSFAGVTYQLKQGFLARQLLEVCHCPIDDPPFPWAEHHGNRYSLELVDRIANASRPRNKNPDAARLSQKNEKTSIELDPSGSALSAKAARLRERALSEEE